MCKRKLGLILITTLILIAGCKSTESAPPGSPTPSTILPTLPSITEAPTSTQSPPPTYTPEPSPTLGSVQGASLGKIVFYSERDGNAELYTMNPDGSDQQRLTFNQVEDSSPAWSPNGRQIAFISDRDDPEPLKCFPRCLYQLYLINADGSEEHKLVETEQSTLHPDWHPDGTKISFDSEFNLQGNIYVVNSDGSGLQLLIEDGFWGDWSPDGSQIVFASDREGSIELYIANTDGGNQQRLTHNQRMEFFPAWSPDGERIAFMTGQPPRMQIHIINVDGSNEQQLTSQGRVNEDPSWSPDGRYIVFQSTRDGNFEIYILEVDGILRGDGELGLWRLTDTAEGDFWPSWGSAVSSDSGT
jgi:Tol biopolymer transport system component